jgi:glucose/arabinose dehydrogenase/plastocyanin
MMTKRSLLSRLLVVLVPLATLLPSLGWSEDHQVQVGNFFFSPTPLTILKGDTVTWTNVSGVHTTTSSSGLWDSGLMSVGSPAFSYTFTSNGTFNYICSIHLFAGVVNVTDILATVSITDAGYSAATVTVVRGDFVRWTNTSSAVRAVNSGTRPTQDHIWDSGSIPPGGVFSFQFNSIGSFPYFDSLDATNPAFSGLVNVIDVTNLEFTGISESSSNGVALQWVMADSRKYDLVYRPSLLSAGGFQLAQANLKTSGKDSGNLSNLPYVINSLNPAVTNLFYRLNILPDNIPALPLALDVVASNFVSPVGLKEPNDGSHRLFVADQIGKIMIIASNRTVMAAPFLDITGIINNLGPAFTGATNGLNPSYDERGLQGMAFDPGFTTNKRFFVYYNSPKSGSNINCEAVLAAYHVSSTNVNVADTNGTIIFRVDKPEFNHNGGCITFGPDGYLYLPTGDGGGGGDQHGLTGNAQDKNSYLGKILRLNVSSGTNYTIPPDNPFVGGGGLGEIYAYGFRHPWRISFDRGASNRLVVADVGQDLWEEVDIVQKGGNYGWRIIEGNHAYDPSIAPTLGVNIPSLDYPIHEYGHGPLGIAIIGAAMYRGTNYPELVGNYVFGDFSTSFAAPDGHLYYLSETRSNIWERFAFTLSPSNAPLGRFVKSFGEDQAGELYLLSSTNLGPVGTSGDIRHLRKP